MLIQSGNSALLVIDVQKKLLPGVYDHEALVENCQWLVEVAQLMGVPVIGSEQYPQGVGPTIESLRCLLPDGAYIGKTWFSCVDAPECHDKIEYLGKGVIILCGMEAHVCVLQTALRLLESGKTVYVVADAISARNPIDTEYAIQRMRDEGVKIVTREMVGFEWIRRSDAPQFKAFSTRYLR